MRFLGIDPGVSGGIAFVEDHVADQRPVAQAYPMPKTERAILDLLDWITENQTRACHAMLENVHSSPAMGVVSAFTFGRGVGALRMALVAQRIPFDLVAPVKWQNGMECRQPKGQKAKFGSKDKNITKRRAEYLFPHVPKITHATADALLLAEYARRMSRALLDLPGLTR